MKNKWCFPVIMISLFILLVGCQTDKTLQNENHSEQDQNIEQNESNVTSDEQEKAEVHQEEKDDHRIIATTVAITEFMDVLEIDLVGVPSSYKELPARYANATEIGNPMWPDMEVLMSLQPTDVLSVTTLKEDLQADFEKIDVPATFLNLESADSMFAEILALGDKYDRVEQAEQLMSDIAEQIKKVEEKVIGEQAPKVLILMGIPGSYIVGTEHSYIGDLVKRVGGENAVTDREEEYISANTEYLQQLEPDVILRAAHGAPEEVVKMFDKEFAENDIWKHFKAVQHDKVYDLEETLFGTTANLAVVEAMEELVEILYQN